MGVRPDETYHPNVIDFFEYAVAWLTTPGGNLVWDVGLQILAIIFTVLFIQRWIDKREENRWLPLKHQTYILLTMITNELVEELRPPDIGERQRRYYYFGERPVVSSLSPDIGNNLMELDDVSFVSQAKEIIALQHKSRTLYQNYLEFQATIGRGSVILSREPELSSLVSNLDIVLPLAVDELTAILGISPDDKEDLVWRAEPLILSRHLKGVAQEAYRLNEWLRSQSDATSDTLGSPPVQ